MNTNRGIASSSTITANKSAPSVAPVPRPSPPPIPFEAKPIPTLVKIMQSVKTDTPKAKLNKHSIDDGNGGRIEMNEGELNGTIFGSISDKVW